MNTETPVVSSAKKKRAKIDEELMLHRRGTKLADITPGAIISAARVDMANKVYNAGLKTGRRKYNFLGKHVRNAKDVRGLITLACDRNSDATSSANINTRRIYDSRESLSIALGQLSA